MKEEEEKQLKKLITKIQVQEMKKHDFSVEFPRFIAISIIFFILLAIGLFVEYSL